MNNTSFANVVKRKRYNDNRDDNDNKKGDKNNRDNNDEASCIISIMSNLKQITDLLNRKY